MYEFILIELRSGKEKKIKCENLSKAEQVAMKSYDLYQWSIFHDDMIEIVYNDIIVSYVDYIGGEIHRQTKFIEKHNLNHII